MRESSATGPGANHRGGLVYDRAFGGRVQAGVHMGRWAAVLSGRRCAAEGASMSRGRTGQTMPKSGNGGNGSRRGMVWLINGVLAGVGGVFVTTASGPVT